MGDSMLAKITQLGFAENQNTHPIPANDRPRAAGVRGSNVRTAVEIVGSVPA